MTDGTSVHRNPKFLYEYDVWFRFSREFIKPTKCLSLWKLELMWNQVKRWSALSGRKNLQSKWQFVLLVNTCLKLRLLYIQMHHEFVRLLLCGICGWYGFEWNTGLPWMNRRIFRQHYTVCINTKRVYMMCDIWFSDYIAYEVMCLRKLELMRNWVKCWSALNGERIFSMIDRHEWLYCK